MLEDKRDDCVEELDERIKNLEGSNLRNRAKDGDSGQGTAAMEKDPWIHRSARMHCGTCMWFVEKKTFRRLAAKPLGRCRRHAPSMNGYPVVFANDWCGDHKLDEEKA